MIDTIFDVGEIGYSLYHYFHLNWRKAQGEDPPRVVVWTLPDRMRIYKGEKAVMVRSDLPYQMLSHLLVRNSFLYNGEPPIEEMFAECNIEPNTIIHGWKDYDWKNYHWYGDKMLVTPFESYASEVEEYNEMKKKLDPLKKNIILFPRHKVGSKYMEHRNWNGGNWKELWNLLFKETDYNIIICGKRGQTSFSVSHNDRTLSIVNKSPFAMIIAALNDPDTILAISSQSFGGKLALLQNVDTVMWGHQRHRHQVEENWSNDNTICYYMDSPDYDIEPRDVFSMITNVLKLKGG